MASEQIDASKNMEAAWQEGNIPLVNALFKAQEMVESPDRKEGALTAVRASVLEIFDQVQHGIKLEMIELVDNVLAKVPNHPLASALQAFRVKVVEESAQAQAAVGSAGRGIWMIYAPKDRFTQIPANLGLRTRGRLISAPSSGWQR